MGRPGKSAKPPLPWRQVIWPLAAAETLVWAALYYSFPALVVHWEADLGWSKADLTTAFTLALLVAALAAPLAGRIIDRGQGRWLMMGSSTAGGLLILALAFVETQWLFTLVWVLIGLTLSGCLYEPCFAYLTRLLGAEARRAITTVTLIAGFAGTLSFPTANAVAAAAGWRVSAMVFAGLVLFLAVPLFWYATRRTATPETAALAADSGEQEGALKRTLRRPAFWALALAFVAIALNHGAIITHLLPLLAERGLSSDAAVLAASMIGPMQVAGRLGLMALDRYLSMIFLTGLCFLLFVCAAAALWAAAAVPALLVAFVLLQGSAIGMTSITRPVVLAELLGRAGFGSISGALALPYMLGTAFAPTLAALIWVLGGYDLVLLAIGATTLVGLAGFLLAVRLTPPAQRHRS